MPDGQPRADRSRRRLGRWLRPSACTAIALFSTGTVAPKARVGSDFSLLPEFEQAGFVLSSGEQRVEWMMRRYRRNPTFGLVGNRLLVHDLVRSFGFPQAPVIYGAFFGAQLGAWPQYSREGLRRALEAGHAAFVVESALAAETSSIVSAPTRVLGVSEVASFIERALQTPPIRDGPAHSMYERRGVVVRAPSSAVPGGPPAVALGLHIVIDPRGLRRIGSAHAAPVGAREGAYVNLCDRQEVVCMEQRAALCGWLVPLLRRLRAHLQKVAMRLSTALDADWLRVDFVISPDGTFVVDKLAYPSELTARRYPHSRYDDDCSPRSLARAYRQRSMEVTNSSAVLVGLLRRIRVDAKAYLRVDAARRLRTLRSIEPS